MKTESRTATRTILFSRDEQPVVIAQVLSDGTIRRIEDDHASGPDDRRFTRGSLSGSNWTLWWERRSWNDA